MYDQKRQVLSLDIYIFFTSPLCADRVKKIGEVKGRGSDRKKNIEEVKGQGGGASGVISHNKSLLDL